MTDKPSNAAIRAGNAVYKACYKSGLSYDPYDLAELIDQETGLMELIEALERYVKKYPYMDGAFEAKKALARAKGET